MPRIQAKPAERGGGKLENIRIIFWSMLLLPFSPSLSASLLLLSLSLSLSLFQPAFLFLFFFLSFSFLSFPAVLSLSFFVSFFLCFPVSLSLSKLSPANENEHMRKTTSFLVAPPKGRWFADLKVARSALKAQASETLSFERPKRVAHAKWKPSKTRGLSSSNSEVLTTFSTNKLARQRVPLTQAV